MSEEVHGSQFTVHSRTLAVGCLEKIGQEVMLEGWVQVVRSHGKIAFIDLRDRTGLIQIGAFEGDLPDVFSKLGSQDVVRIQGIVKERGERYVNKNLATGTIEIEAKKLEVIQKAEVMPFDMGGYALNLELPTLLDFRTLTLRHQSVFPIFKIQEALMNGFRAAAKQLMCTEIFTPTISYSSTEGGAEVFNVDYYGHKTFLIQSPQLYKQMMVPTFERVFLVSHAYRAEPSVTTRHLSESTQLDCELGFVTFEDLLDSVEYVARETLMYVSIKHEDILTQFGVKRPLIPEGIPRLTMREAQEIIFKRTGRDCRQEKDLAPEDEKEISLWALTEHKSDLVTITHFPTKKRAFYTEPDPENPEFSLSYDIVFRGVEIMSGSKRIHDPAALKKVIAERGMKVEDFALYLQAFEYGMPPHGGFSFGLERLTMKFLELKNIREASLFPRDMERVDIRFSARQDHNIHEARPAIHEKKE